jgi:hypothetical protein
MNHVVARQMKPLSAFPEINGLMPLECEVCGEKVYLGLPISAESMVTLTRSFTNAHENCTEEQ